MLGQQANGTIRCHLQVSQKRTGPGDEWKWGARRGPAAIHGPYLPRQVGVAHLVHSTWALATFADGPDDEGLAEQVGYSEPSAFRHLFRKLVGETPSAYRRRYLRVEEEAA
jgi:hypothetical protein